MNDLLHMFGSDAKVIAAVVALIGVLVAEWLNRKKFKVDMQQITNEFHQQRETETEWGKQVDEIAIMKRGKMNEKTLLIVRNLLGAMQGSYGNPSEENEQGYKVTRPQYKILTILNGAENKVNTLDYYENFKNSAMDYVEFLHKRYVKEGFYFRYLGEEEAENLRMICRVLKQDRWITKDITGKTTYLVNEFSFFSRINEAEVQFFKEKSTLKVGVNLSIIVFFTIVVPLVFTIYNHSNLMFKVIICVLIILVGITLFIRYITFNTVLMERQDYVSRKEAQQKKAGEILKEYLEENDQNYKKRNNAIQKEEEEREEGILSKLHKIIGVVIESVKS